MHYAFKEPRIFDGRERRLEEREAKKKRKDESAVQKAIINTEDEGIDRDDVRQNRRIQQRKPTPGHFTNTEPNDDDLSKRDQSESSENRLQNEPNSYLASLDESLTNLIPAEELEEMMSEDFLFCGGGTISTARQEEKTEELAAPLSMSQVPRKEDCAPSRRRESTTTSRRRSARLSVHTNLTGSIFIDQEENSWFLESVGGNSLLGGALKTLLIVAFDRRSCFWCRRPCLLLKGAPNTLTTI